MTYDPERHHRRTMRWEGYDYGSAGMYVVTIVTAGRRSLFGTVVDDVMVVSALGAIVETEWWRSAELRPEFTMDAFVVMPNHIHGIVAINEPDSDGGFVGAHGRAPGHPNSHPHAGADTQEVGPNDHAHIEARVLQERAHGRVPLRQPRSLGSLVAGFKSATTTRINMARGTPRMPVWRRDYHDRVIQNEDELETFRWYVEENPTAWVRDREYALV